METTLVLLKNKLESIRQLTEVDSETKTTPQTVFTETLKEESNDTTANEKFEKKTGESLEEKNTSWSPDKSVKRRSSWATCTFKNAKSGP